MKINKLMMITGAVMVAILAACILVYRMLTSGQVAPLALLALAAVISILLPMLRANFLPSARDCDAEFAYHTQRRDAFVLQQITDNLGPTVSQRIRAAPDASQQAPEDYLLTLLEGKKAGSNADLRFALLVVLAQQHEKNGDPEAAIKSLAAAQHLRPQDFVTRCQLARNFAWLGNTAESGQIYRRILDNPEGLSRAMIKLTRRRVKELEGH